MKVRLVLVLVTIAIFLIVGCQPPQNLQEVSKAPNLSERAFTKPFNPLFFRDELIAKLSVPAEQFYTIAEWLDDETVLYIIETSSQSEVRTFNIFTGESSTFFVSNAPILSILANGDYKLFAIHTAPSYLEGTIHVVNATGDHVMEWNFPNSNDLVYSWNSYTNEQLVVSSFMEDWSFEGYLLDVTSQSMVKRELANPFIQWLDKEKLGYINWDPDEPSLTAPLYAEDIVTNSLERLTENVVMFQSSKDLLVTVTKHSGEMQEVEYQLWYLPSMEVIHEFSAPILSMYSNYYVPYFEYVEGPQLLYAFLPYESGALDTYTKSFQLVSYNINTGERKVELEEVENKPIKFSPNGLYFLYGHQLEQLMVLPNNEIMDLVDYS